MACMLARVLSRKVKVAKQKFKDLILHETQPKKTSIGNGRISKSMMNKSKRRSYKRYKGQGR